MALQGQTPQPDHQLTLRWSNEQGRHMTGICCFVSAEVGTVITLLSAYLAPLIYLHCLSLGFMHSQDEVDFSNSLLGRNSSTQMK